MDYLSPGTVDQVDIKTMCISFTLSTPIIDRADDVIEIGALSLKSHERLPYLCFSHERLHPIGLCQEPENKAYLLKWEKMGLMGKAYFAQDNWDSEWLFDKVVKGLLNGVSPGFIPKSFKLNPESKKGGRIYTAADKEHLVNDLLEASVCVNGENPEAVVHLVEKCLKEQKKPSEWVEKKFAEVYKVTSTTKPVIVKSFNPEFKAIFDEWVATIDKKVPEKLDKDIQACVDRKIPILLNEGYPKDQAAAIAYSMCGEKGKKAMAKEGNTPAEGTEEKKAMTAGAVACKAIHGQYMKLKELFIKHKALQEDESPIKTHLEEQEKAVDALRAENKTLHDERYGKDHGELEDVEGSSEEVGKNLANLATIQKEFKAYQARTDKIIRDQAAEIVKFKKQVGNK